jgi:hypothetical protein
LRSQIGELITTLRSLVDGADRRQECHQYYQPLRVTGDHGDLLDLPPISAWAVCADSVIAASVKLLAG